MSQKLPSPQAYAKKVRATLNASEQSVFRRLTTPQKIQDFLEKLPMNFDDTHYSVRYSLKARRAQCIEGALIAAAALAYHGKAPLLMDFQTLKDDEDHVVALFQHGRYWGAMSKTNHPILRYRDPIYASIRELGMSYFHEYYLHGGRKSMTGFSGAFDLRQFEPEAWITSPKHLWWLDRKLDRAKHEAPLPSSVSRTSLRRVSSIELQTLKLVEFTQKKKTR